MKRSLCLEIVSVSLVRYTVHVFSCLVYVQLGYSRGGEGGWRIKSISSVTSTKVVKIILNVFLCNLKHIIAY